jgi:DNA-binding CsgD family transcriptional regulator
MLGRAREREQLDRLIAGARAGTSGALVIRGDAGMGKTALLGHVATQSTGCRVIRATAVESEMELAYAGLHQLCQTLAKGLDALPTPQRDAVVRAFGLREGAVPDRFLVGLGVLSLFAETAEARPLVCLVDDAHWLDQASLQILGFVARRLGAEAVIIVFGVRHGSDVPDLAGLPEMILGPLGVDDARAMLASVMPGRVDEAVRNRIIAEAHGNPLALLELPRAWATAGFAGGYGLPEGGSLSGRIEESFRRRFLSLPDETRRLLLVAAAESAGDPAVVWAAADRLGIRAGVDGPAATAGLVEAGILRFRHPLVRTVVYEEAAADERRSVHQALADVTDPTADPDRRAWHRAAAATGPDDDIALELIRAADRAQGRGGAAAAAAFLGRAVALTPDPTLRAARALEAARAKDAAGAHDDAEALLTMAEAGPLDRQQRAVVQLCRGSIAFASSHGRDAPPVLLEAARLLEPFDDRSARRTYLDALAAAFFVGRMADSVGILEVGEAIQRARLSSDEPPDLLLRGFAAVVAEGYTAGAPRLRNAVDAFLGDETSDPNAIRWLWLATHAAHDLWDADAWDVLSARHLRLVREVGAMGVFPLPASARVGIHLFAGELDQAEALVYEIAAVVDGMALRIPPYSALALAAWRGEEARATALADEILSAATIRGDGMGTTIVHHAKAVLFNGLGRYDDALAAAESGAAHPVEMAFAMWSLVQLIEAGVRTDRTERATAALERLAQFTQASGTDWALGVEARCRGLVSEDSAAEDAYRESLERLGRTRLAMEVARTQLVYGEWLRREGRRVDSREQLRAAHDLFGAVGADAYADRARTELQATGETIRKRSVDTLNDLTPQELQIARLARDGRSNPEIGEQLFLSPRTVEWHLRKVFSKLGVASRKDLRVALPQHARLAVGA